MIGPAFISAPESASPQSSITPGKARPITPSACVLAAQREHAGRQPLGTDGDRRLERPVLAREPRQRAGLGERGIGAIAGIAQRPWRTCTEPNVPGGRNTTCPSVRCGASARAMSCCAVAGAGQRMSSASAHGVGDVVGDRATSFASCRPRKSLTDDRAAGRVVRFDRRPVAPPQAHLVARERQVARRRERAVAAAEDGDFHADPCSVAGGSAVALTVPSAISSLSRSAAPCPWRCAAGCPRTRIRAAP